MAVIQCSRLLHFYDNEKYDECPHCANMEKARMPVSDLDTQSVNYAAEYIRKNTVHTQAEDSGKAAKKETSKSSAVSRYAAGWLVCTKGEDYGRDFPIYSGHNYIGTGSYNDIVLKDDRLSANAYCSVVYEERKNVFYLVPKQNKPVFIEDEPVDSPERIQGGQPITLGNTCLELVVFCSGEKRWLKR